MISKEYAILKNIIYFTIITATVGFLSNIGKAETEAPDIGSLDIKQEVYTFRVEGFDKNKKVRWGLKGESANVVGDKININNLEAVYYGDDMTLTLLAKSAVYDKKTQDIELKDNIVGKTSDGGELMTDYAKWYAEDEEIRTDSHVVIKRQNVVCRGKGLVTKPRLKQVTFREDVDVDFGPDKKITCKGPFEIDHDESKAIFNNDVKVIEKESEMITDKLTVYLNPETNEVDRIITEGNVKVVHRGELDQIGDMGKLPFN